MGAGVEHRQDDEDEARTKEAARRLILDDPDAVLGDPEVMRALLKPPEATTRKVIDLRAALVARLEDRMERLLEAHRGVVEAALDNLSCMEEAHEAALALIDAPDFLALARAVRRDLPERLRVDVARLCLPTDLPLEPAARPRRIWPFARLVGRRAGRSERLRARRAMAAGAAETRAAPQVEAAEALGPEHEASGKPARAALLVTRLAPKLLAASAPKDPRRGGEDAALERRAPVLFRDAAPGDALFFGDATRGMRAVAIVRLDLGLGRAPGVLALGSSDPRRFRTGSSAELAAFLGGVIERRIRAYLGDPR